MAKSRLRGEVRERLQKVGDSCWENRHSLGLTQKELAKILDINVNTIVALEGAKNDISFSNLCKLWLFFKSKGIKFEVFY